MKISIIVPVLNESEQVRTFLDDLARVTGVGEVIVVDGGSADGTADIVRAAARGGVAPRLLWEDGVAGRARQMNLGAQHAGGDVLLFLHADSKLASSALSAVQSALTDARVIGGGFYKRYDRENWLLAVYRIAINLVRTKWLRNLVGTNAIFVRRDAFAAMGMYPDVPILEDVILSDRMKKTGRLVFLRPHVICSGRRYRSLGILHRIWISVRVLFLFRVFKESPETLWRLYMAQRKS